jgi:Ca-activated chloride channel family protein
VTRAIAPALLALSIVPDLSAQQVPVFRGSVDLVNLAVTVTDKKGNLVGDLTMDDFEVYEDGRKQNVRFFAGGDPGGAAPEMHLGLTLDVSESMGEDMSFTKTAAVKFLNSLVEAVDVTIVDFDTEVRVTRYSQSDFARLIERIRQQKAGGWTALYDAIGVYLDGAASQSGRKVMVLYTDGGDTRSSISFGELTDLLKASDATIYVIGELEHQPSSLKSDQRLKLQQIADLTGGKAFFPLSVKELDQIYEKALAEIHAQYLLGYLSTNDRADGTWRKVEIKVRSGGADAHQYHVRARRGYFAPFRSSK